MRRFRLLGTLGFLALVRLAPGCGSDPQPMEPCTHGIADFELLITAADQPLPEDLVVRVEYGGGEEFYVLANPGNQDIIFCKHADRERNLLPDGGAGSGSGGEGGGDGEGGGAGARAVEALLCEIWSFGSARVEVQTAAYPMTEPLQLVRKRDVCTVKAELELSQPDAGVGSRAP